jgi:tRNA threonylcarbamoyladenosine biosynthesis protein TsaE
VSDTRVFVTESEAETASLGERIGQSLAAGDVLLLFGDLGAGKTALVRGLARGVGAEPDEVSSPTFTLIQEYGGGRVPLVHVDLYRLAPREVDDLGLDEMVEGGGIVAIEWADRWPDRPANAMEIRLEHAGDTRRRISVRTSATDSAGF